MPNTKQQERGAGLEALLSPLARIAPYDRDLARFARLEDEIAAAELEDALFRLPELRRAFTYRVLHALMRAVIAGGGWRWAE
jgi:hypothetical protein